MTARGGGGQGEEEEERETIQEQTSKRLIRDSPCESFHVGGERPPGKLGMCIGNFPIFNYFFFPERLLF